MWHNLPIANVKYVMVMVQWHSYKPAWYWFPRYRRVNEHNLRTLCWLGLRICWDPTVHRYTVKSE